jgi:hypothetical protein
MALFMDGTIPAEDYASKIAEAEKTKADLIGNVAAELLALEERRAYLLGIIGKKRRHRKTRVDAGKPRERKALRKGLPPNTFGNEAKPGPSGGRTV